MGLVVLDVSEVWSFCRLLTFWGPTHQLLSESHPLGCSVSALPLGHNHSLLTLTHSPPRHPHHQEDKDDPHAS